FVNMLLGGFFRGFNKAFDVTIGVYGRAVSVILRLSVLALVVYGGLLALTLLAFKVVPQGFIPEQDKGYLVVNAQLPDGAALGRTDGVVARLREIARKASGGAYTSGVAGCLSLRR